MWHPFLTVDNTWHDVLAVCVTLWLTCLSPDAPVLLPQVLPQFYLCHLWSHLVQVRFFVLVRFVCVDDNFSYNTMCQSDVTFDRTIRCFVQLVQSDWRVVFFTNFSTQVRCRLHLPPFRNLGNFITPYLPVYSGRDTKSRWSFLSGVYARRCKRSHTGSKCVTCSGLTNSRDGQL